MIHIGDWEDYELYITLRIGEGHFTVISRNHSVEEVIGAVLEHIDRIGGQPIPFVFLTVTTIDTASIRALLANDLIDIVVE